jgi:pilus assembly protein CpaB
MRPIVVVFVLFAVVMAGLAAFLAKVWLDRRTAPVAVQQQAQVPAKPAGMINVLVAARAIHPGSRLVQDDIRWAAWPEDTLQDRYIREEQLAKAEAAVATPGAAPTADTGQLPIAKKDAEAPDTNTGTVVIGAIARREIIEGEPIRLDAIIQPGDHSVVSALLTPGNRAISVPISTESAAAGFISPGDRVDVLLASNVRSAIGETDNKKRDIIINWATETVLRDVKVLAIDQRLSHDDKEGPAIIGKTATLDVSPTDAERLLAAQQLGALSLVLRSMVPAADQDPKQPDDTDDGPMSFTPDREVSKGLSALAGARRTPKNNGNSVRVNRGGALSEQSF